MKPERSAAITVKENRSHRSGLFRSPGYPGSRAASGLLPHISLMSLLRRFFHGISKLTVVARYWLSQGRFTAPVLPKWRLSWWKLALGALTVFIILKKDIQFSVNMRAPAGELIRAESATEQGAQVEKMSLAQSISFHENASGSSAPQDERRVYAYIGRFDGVAVSEMRKFGIPASIKMAQGLLESGAGQNLSARRYNNFFGAPLAGRSYDSAWENWREHSLLLYHEYSSLFENGSNYRKWARGLRQAGYSKDRRYDQKLVEIIEKYRLYELDK